MALTGEVNLRDTVLLVCEMLKDEMNVMLQESGYPGEIVWMKKSLHEYPEKLRSALQEEIDKWQHKSHIILGFGLCGNGLLELKSERAVLVIPAFDDCVRMLLAHEKGTPIRCNARSFYYTEGWLDGTDELENESALISDKYQRIYGEKKGTKILKAMMKNYEAITLIDTGFYDIPECAGRVRKNADLIGLKILQEPGTLRILGKLLAGEWAEEFLLIPPGHAVTQDDFEARPRCVFWSMKEQREKGAGFPDGVRVVD